MLDAVAFHCCFAPGFPPSRVFRRMRLSSTGRPLVTSLAAPAEVMGGFIRGHWAIEKSLHWVLDMTFREDERRVRTDPASANFATIRHMAHNLIRDTPGRDSMRLRGKTAAWNDHFLTSLIGG